jgi:RHS repeat-associated protein
VDNAGNRNSKSDFYAGVTTNYGYDAIYELLNATQAGTTKESYTYDPVGNRLSNLTSSGWNYNTSNELNSHPTMSYNYDYNGNTILKTDSTGSTSYTWDYENRMTSTVLPGSGGTVSFKYDPFGRRIYKSSSSATSVYAYDGDNLIEEANSSGAAVARYSQDLNIDEPLAELRSGTTSYYEADGLWSVTSLSNAAGAIASSYTYDSFGNLVASSGSIVNNFRYTGREWDSETNLYYYRARYYDPQAGRFLSEDPIGFNGGTNFYRYVRNAPVNLVDPFGLNPGVLTLPWWGPLVRPIEVVISGVGAAGAAVIIGIGELLLPPATAIDDARAIPGPICSTRSNPFRGKPGDVSTTRRPDGTPKQARRYGPDGYPDTDVDYDDHGGNGNPHAHDWGRPADGSPPTAGDRSEPGRPVTPSDPRPN